MEETQVEETRALASSQKAQVEETRALASSPQKAQVEETQKLPQTSPPQTSFARAPTACSQEKEFSTPPRCTAPKGGCAQEKERAKAKDNTELRRQCRPAAGRQMRAQHL